MIGTIATVVGFAVAVAIAYVGGFIQGYIRGVKKRNSFFNEMLEMAKKR